MMTPQNQAAYNANRDQYSKAYAWVKEAFGLTAAQRDKLDVSPSYRAIMEAAINGDLVAVHVGLFLAGIIAGGSA